MSAHQQDVDRARNQIHETTQKADSYLTELTKRVEEYESKHTGFEPASTYIKSALDASRSATQKLKTHGQDLSERSIPVALEGMHAVRESLDTLEKDAVAYDQKYTNSHGQEAVEKLHDYVNVGRQHATSALETTNEQLMKLRDAIGNMAGQATHGAQVIVGEAVRVAEFGDEKLGVSSVAGGVVQKVRDLDACLGVTAAAAKIDSTLTGGLGCKLASTTVDIVTESVNYLSETLQNAKLAAQNSETAQSVEAKGSTITGAAVAKKNELQQTFNDAFDKGKETIGMATEKTVEKAGEMKDMADEKAGQATEMAKEKAGQTKGKADEMVDVTKEKSGQAKEMAKEKVGESKEKGSEMIEMAEDKVGKAKEKGSETTATIKNKVGKTKETTKVKAGEAVESAKGKADRAKK